MSNFVIEKRDEHFFEWARTIARREVGFSVSLEEKYTKDGRPYLQLSNGATITILDFLQKNSITQ